MTPPEPAVLVERVERALEVMALERNAWRSEALRSREQIRDLRDAVLRFSAWMDRYRDWLRRREGR